MQPITVTVGPLTAANDQAIAAAQSLAGLTFTLTANPVVLDQARQIVITSAGNDSAITFTVVGTTYGNQPQTEVIKGANATTTTSVLNWKTITSITASAPPAGAVKAGTTTVAGSRWVRFDSWANAPVTLQADASGTVNYTIQTTLDDPNDPFNPVTPVNVTWFPSTDAGVVGANASKQSNFTNAPTFTRVLLNSGTGSVTTTFAQFGSVPY